MTLISVNDDLRRRLRITTVSIAAWGGVAALFALQRVYAVTAKGIAPVWNHLALEMGVVWGTWAVLTPVILFVVRRLPLTSKRPRRVLLHVPIGIGVGLLHSLLVAAITPLFIWRPSFAPIRDMFAGRLATAIAFETLIYFLVAAVFYAFLYATQSRQRQTAIVHAEASLLRAQLDARRLEELLGEITDRVHQADSLTVPARDGLIKVPVDSIDWLQSEDNYVRLHTDGQSHLLRTTLSALEKTLATRDFVRIHRSAMVRVPRIAKLRRVASDRYTVVLTNGAQLRVSRGYRKKVIAAVQTPLTP